MNTVITIVVVLAMVGLLVMMVNYARFIHSYKGEAQPPNENDSLEKSDPDDKEES